VPENWVDVIILFMLAVYGLRGVQRGLLLGLIDLAGFILALAAALRFYPVLTEAVAPHVPVPVALVKPLAFIAVWLAADVAFSLFVRLVGGAVTAVGSRSPVNALLGFLPGALKGAVVAGLVIALALALPLPEPVKAEIAGSALGGSLSGELRVIERTLQDVFGDAVLDGINFATVRPQTDQRVPLKFSVPDARFDEEAEARMLKLLNDERAHAGLKPLTTDPALVQAARLHSRDMLAQGYFAHVNNEGKSPADRARAAGVRFMATGENLALAPTVELAHRGLMESPGHRANILGAQWSRVGIGVADAGIHGKTFAQEFAD
jgi:uncharacterized protein YkwD/uncharacterized membrane protein required for colicin V production